MADNIEKLNLQEYQDLQDKENSVKLDTSMADYISEGPVTTDLVQKEIKKAQAESNYAEMNAITSSISDIDSSEDIAKSRLETAKHQLKANMDKLEPGRYEELIKKSEEAEGNDGNIIFQILDLMARPMYAMEGAVVGAFARKDETYDGLNVFQRILAGVEDGWTGAEDDEGNRIVTDAAVLGALLTGTHDTTDWKFGTRMLAALPTMFFFGKYDPMMKAFSLLANSKHTVKDGIRAMQDSNLMPKAFKTKRFNTAEGDMAIAEFIDANGKALNDLHTGSSGILMEKFGLKAFDVFNKDANKYVDIGAYEKELRRRIRKQINHADVQKSKVAAEGRDLFNMLYDDFTDAILDGDIGYLKDAGIFKTVKEMSGFDLSDAEALQYIRDIKVNGDKVELLQAFYMEMTKRLHQSFLPEKGYRLTMNEAFSHIARNDKAEITLTKMQMNRLKSKFLETGMIDNELLADIITEMRQESLPLLYNADQLKEAKRLRKELEKASKVVKQDPEGLELLRTQKESIGEINELAYVVDFLEEIDSDFEGISHLKDFMNSKNIKKIKKSEFLDDVFNEESFDLFLKAIEPLRETSLGDMITILDDDKKLNSVLKQLDKDIAKLEKQAETIKESPAKNKAKIKKLDKEIEEMETYLKENKVNTKSKVSKDENQISTAMYDEMYELATGQGKISAAENEAAQVNDALSASRQRSKGYKKSIEDKEAQIKKIKKDIETSKAEAVKKGYGTIIDEGNYTYKSYLEEKHKYETAKFNIDKGFAAKRVYEEKTAQAIQALFLDTPVNLANPEKDSIGRLNAILKDDFNAWKSGIKERMPGVYKTLEEMKFFSKVEKLPKKKFLKQDMLEAAENAGNKITIEQNTLLKSRAHTVMELDNLADKVYMYNMYEKNTTLEDVEKTLADSKKKLKARKQRLNKLFDKYEIGEKTVEGEELKLLVGNIKKKTKLLEEETSKLADYKANLATAERDISNYDSKLKELTKRIGDEAANDSQEMLTGMNAMLSYAGIKKLEPILKEFVSINNVGNYLTNADNPLNRVGLFTISANRKSKHGKAWLNQLQDIRTGAAAPDFDWSQVPFVNQRFADALSEFINIGVSGRKFTSTKLQQLSARLKGLQTKISGETIKAGFQDIEGGEGLYEELMMAHTRQANAITGEVMDSEAQYAKKVLNQNLNYKARASETGKFNKINNELTGRADEQGKLNQQGLNAFSSSNYVGDAATINEIKGRQFAKATKSTYNKYDVTQQLFLTNPFATNQQLYQDSQLMGDFVSTLAHAADNGVFFSGDSAPAALVKQGRLVRMSKKDFSQSLQNLIKLEVEKNSSALMEAEIQEAKKLKSLGVALENEDMIKDRTQGMVNETMDRTGNYVESFIDRYFDNLATSVDEEGPYVFVPKELQKILQPKKIIENERLESTLQAFDKAMNGWKKFTLLSPGFNFKNIFGNFVSMYIVDPGGMSGKALQEGRMLYNKLPEFAEVVKRITAKGVTEESLHNADDVRRYILNTLKENPKDFTDFVFPEQGIKSAADFFLLAEQAEEVRVIDPTIDSIIGRDNKVGNLHTAMTPKDINEALRAAYSVAELAKTDPRMANMLSGMGYEIDKPSNLFKQIIDGNLAASHDMTSSVKMYQLMNNNSYERKWFNEFASRKGTEKLSLSEFDDLINEMPVDKRDAWNTFKREKYQKDFGYSDSATMIQDMFFDPGALTQGEKNIASRLVPFWGFFKKSLELSFNRLNKLDFRGMYGIERGIKHIMDTQNIDNADMSEFARNEQYLPFKINDNKIVNVKWGNPTQTLNNLIVRDKNILAELFGNANPVLKFMASEVANREDLFFGGKYDSLVDEAFGTLAPGAVRNFQRQLKYYNGEDELDMEDQKSILAKIAPSIFADQNITDNNVAAFNAAALILEKELNKLIYDEGYQLSRDVAFPELPSYQEFILDLW